VTYSIVAMQENVVAMMKRISFLIVTLVYCTYGVTCVGEDIDTDVSFDTFNSFPDSSQKSTINDASENCLWPPCAPKRKTPTGGTCPTGSRLNGPPAFACEEKINEQIHEELKASDIYLSMAAYFKRYDVSLLGFEGFFKKSADEERLHAKKLMDYLNKRGGIVKMNPRADYPPEVNSGDWRGALEAVKAAHELEKKVLIKLQAVHQCGADSNDANLQDFIESEYLTEQYESIEELSNMITKVTRLGCGVGLHIFDEGLKK